MPTHTGHGPTPGMQDIPTRTGCGQKPEDLEAPQPNFLQAAKDGDKGKQSQEDLDNKFRKDDIPSWDNESIQYFENLKKDAVKEARVSRFGNFYKDPKTGLWWSKDKGLHGGPHYKVFKETAKGFEHQYNADLHGNKIIGQHKGPVGAFVSLKEIIFKS